MCNKEKILTLKKQEKASQTFKNYVTGRQISRKRLFRLYISFIRIIIFIARNIGAL